MSSLDTNFYKTFFSRIGDRHLNAEMRLAKIQGKSLVHELAVMEVNKRAEEAKPKTSYAPNQYTEEECEVLREFSTNWRMTLEEVQEKLPGRSRTAIYNKMSRMGISRPYLLGDV